MDEQKIKIYKAISSFVQDLDTGFGRRYKPVALYNRLTKKTTTNDVIAVDRHINAFRTFFSSNPDYIKSKTLANNVRISYSDRVYLDVGHILSKTDSDAHKHIHQHLMTIYTLINIGTKDGREALETLKQNVEADAPDDLDLNLPDTKEGNFIKDTLTEMTDHFDNMEENANPMTMMTSMMQSGFFTKFMGDLQTQFSNGDMNIQSLMGTVTSIISETTPQGGEEASQIKTFVNQSMSQVTNLTGGALPDELQGQMDTLLNAIGGDKPVIEPVNEEDSAGDDAN